jgi:DNA polymerase III subunit alpha
MQKCKIKSVKPIGKAMTYNVEMEGEQHNYKIVSSSGIGVYTGNSHSAAYSFLAYQTAWLKIYYPLEFMSSLMSSEIGSADKGEKMDGYLKECKNMDIVVLQPNINKSKMKFTIEDMIDKNGNKKSIIRHPLTGIDGVGEAAAQSIMENQKYKDLKDFVSKINGSKVNTRVFQALVDTGCFDDEWNMKRAEILASYESLKNTVSKEKVDKKKQEKYIEEHGGGGFLWLGGEGSEITL